MPKFTESEILEMPCSDVANIIVKYIEFREMILKAYPNIFAPQFDEQEDTTEYTAEELKEIEDEKKQTSHSWEKFIMKCCNNDMTKFDSVTNMNLILVFNLFVTL
jgi:lipoate-protein ligase A